MPWGVAAAAVAAGGSYLSAKQQAKGSKTSDPPWVQEASRTALDKATTISNRQYTPYAGQRVAGLSRNELSAEDMARSTEGRSYLDKAGGELGKMQDFSSSALERYKNPYIESVLQPQLREQNTAYQREKSALANSKADARGGDRQVLAQSALQRNHMQNITDVTGKTNADAYTAATQAFFQDQDRHARAAQAYQSLGGDVSRMNTQQIQDLMATGGTRRLLEQADLDFDYQQFTENRDWDTNNLEPLLNAISASKGVSRTTTGPQASPWGQALGAAATVAGMYYTGNIGTSKAPAAQTGTQYNNPAGYDG